MTVSGTLKGGLGNCLFIISTIIGYSLKHKCDYFIPTKIDNPHLPDQKVFFSKNLRYSDEQPPGVKNIYVEPFYHYQEIPKVDCDYLELSGYFQSEKYFSDYRKEILKLLDIHYEFKKDYCAILVRRGDYLNLQAFHPPVTNNYLEQAQIKMMNKGIGKFIIFSDDLEYCRNIMPQFDDADYLFSENKSDIEDLVLASSCAHQIGSNSAYSWWAYYLNRNENKIGIFPQKWYGKMLPHNIKDLIMPEMILL